MSGDRAQLPTETGYYHHMTGQGREEIVFVDFRGGSFWVKKMGVGREYPLSEDKGSFGARVALPSELFE